MSVCYWEETCLLLLEGQAGTRALRGGWPGLGLRQPRSLQDLLTTADRSSPHKPSCQPRGHFLCENTDTLHPCWWQYADVYVRTSTSKAADGPTPASG